MSENFIIKQGETLAKPFYWYDGAAVTKLITAITLAYPPVFTAAGHGLPTDEIPVTLSTIRGPRALNTPAGETVYALKQSTDTFSVPELNASGLSAYIGGGYLRYVPPKDITGYTARMHIRAQKNSATTILELASADGEIIIGDATGKVTLSLTAAATAALSFDTAYYDLELVLGAAVKRLAEGVVTLSKEVTR